VDAPCTPGRAIVIKREFNIPGAKSRPDLVVLVDNRPRVLVEIKTKAFDPEDVRDQLARYAKWAAALHNPCHCIFIAVDRGEVALPLHFKFEPWWSLSIRLRSLISNRDPATLPLSREGAGLIQSAMVLSFCSAVEQNLLALSGQPKRWKVLKTAEYLEAWLSKRRNERE
jgi:hypothetical protein